jgi:hypothetical protein
LHYRRRRRDFFRHFDGRFFPDRAAPLDMGRRTLLLGWSGRRNFRHNGRFLLH